MKAAREVWRAAGGPQCTLRVITCLARWQVVNLSSKSGFLLAWMHFDWVGVPADRCLPVVTSEEVALMLLVVIEGLG